MKLPKWIEKIKLGIQFRKFVKGYSDGYYQAAMRCNALNGTYLRLSLTDITVRSGFCNKPKFKWLYDPWFKGFNIGYTEAVSDYNAGDTPVERDSVNDIFVRLRTEFDDVSSQN